MSTPISNPVKSPFVGKLDEQVRARVMAWVASQMSQAEFGRRIGRNDSWVSRYFDENHDADLDTIKLMAEACGHTIYELLDAIPPSDEGDIVTAYRKIPRADRGTALRTLQLMSAAATPAPKRRRRA